MPPLRLGAVPSGALRNLQRFNPLYPGHACALHTKRPVQPVPQPELVVADAKVVLDEVLGRAENVGDFAVSSAPGPLMRCSLLLGVRFP